MQNKLIIAGLILCNAIFPGIARTGPLQDHFHSWHRATKPSTAAVGVWRYGIDDGDGRGVTSTWENRYLGKGTWAMYATHLDPPLPYTQWQVDCKNKLIRWVNYEGGKAVNSWGAWYPATNDPYDIDIVENNFIYSCHGPDGLKSFLKAMNIIKGRTEEFRLVTESFQPTSPDAYFNETTAVAAGVESTQSSDFSRETPSQSQASARPGRPTLRETLSDTPFQW